MPRSIGVLFEFKPFAYIVLMAALAASAVFSGGDWAARRRFAATIVLGVIGALPFLIGAARLDPSDRRSRLVLDLLLLPRRMLIKIDLTTAFANAARRIAPAALERPVFLLLATAVFFAVGVGIRWAGVAGVWRAIRAKATPESAPWRLLAWGVVAGVAIPCVIATDPYVDTLQFYLTGLFLLWIFTAVALARWARAHPWIGPAAVTAVIAISLPSTVHYVARKWTDADRPAKASLSSGEVRIAEYLRGTDPETTVILHDRPLSPSLMTIVADRRIVLGWDVRYSAVGGEDRLRDVDAFFASADGDPGAAFDILRRYRVTYLIVRSHDDRVHPAVLERLTPVMQFADVALYSVTLP